jgi:hypothetical protein
MNPLVFRVFVTLFTVSLFGLGAWYAALFRETRLVEIAHANADLARQAAEAHLAQYAHRERAQVMATSGRSNAWDHEKKTGFYVLDPGIPYDELQPNLFVVRRSEGKTVMHRLRYQEGPNWVMEGDGNAGPDRERLTRANYLGVVANSTVYRYPAE